MRAWFGADPWFVILKMSGIVVSCEVISVRYLSVAHGKGGLQAIAYEVDAFFFSL